VPYTLVTGITVNDQHIDNVLATPETVVGHEKFERIEAVFSGAGETLSAALAALIATGLDLSAAASEALHYLDRCLDEGFRPGMGKVIPDRLFWALPDTEDEDNEAEAEGPDMNADFFEMPINDTKH
jgi:hydroxymethylpyrimidine/phosphomethylpyrimidine kinase